MPEISVLKPEFASSMRNVLYDHVSLAEAIQLCDQSYSPKLNNSFTGQRLKESERIQIKIGPAEYELVPNNSESSDEQENIGSSL